MRQDQQNTKHTKRKYYKITTEIGVSLNDTKGISKSPKSQVNRNSILGRYLFTKSKLIIYGNNGNKMGIGGG